MSFIISVQSELLKTKRTASFWLSVVAASFLPGIFFLVYFFKPEPSIQNLKAMPWIIHFNMSWQILNSFLFPMYIILICTLIPQIEYKNNAWKQVFSSPQSFGTIFFSKFLTIHLVIFFFYILFNLLMILSAVIATLLNPKFPFLSTAIDWGNLIKLNLKTYLSILGISAIQYWLSLRFKNFIAPVGIGLALLIGAIISINFRWEHVDKVPYAYPIRTLAMMVEQRRSGSITGRPFIENHELNSAGYFIFFTLLAFLDMKFRKEKG